MKRIQNTLIFWTYNTLYSFPGWLRGTCIHLRCSRGQGSSKTWMSPREKDSPSGTRLCKKVGTMALRLNLYHCFQYAWPGLCHSTFWSFFLHWYLVGNEFTACSLCFDGSFPFPSQCPLAWLVPISHSGLTKCLLWADATLTTPTTSQMPFHTVSVAGPPLSPCAFWHMHSPAWLVTHLSLSSGSSPWRVRTAFHVWSPPPSSSPQFNADNILESMMNHWRLQTLLKVPSLRRSQLK